MENELLKLNQVSEWTRKDPLFGDEGVEYRESAWKSLSRQNWPTRKSEQWKYTSIKNLLDLEFNSRAKEPSQELLETAKNKIHKMDLLGSYIVFLNGQHLPQLSHIQENLEVSIVDANKKSLTQDQIQRLENAKGNILETQSRFDLMARAFSDKIIFLSTSKNQKVDKPVYMVNLSSSTEPFINQAYINIYCAENSFLSFSEIYGALDEGIVFNNIVTDCHLDQGSQLHYLKVQNENDQSFHVSLVNVNQSKDSRLEAMTVSVGGKITRNNLLTSMNGPGAHADINGLYLTKKSQHIDNHTHIDHKSAHTTSQQLYKGILDDESRAVFNGKVKIHPDAQKVDSSQMNKNLLLSSKAEVDSKPELEVFADDVKAAHGSAIGELDTSQVFYFQSRGIDEEEAHRMLSRGYVDEVVFKSSNKEFKDVISKKLDQIITDFF